jgi:hypothetical protein
LGAALASLREGAGSGVDDALDLFPVTGDRDTQRALDTYLEQLADLLREVEASAGELEATLRMSGRGRGRPTGVGASAATEPGAPVREDVGSRRSR